MKWNERNQFIPPDLREAATAEQPVVKGEGYVRLIIHPGFQNRGWRQPAARLRAAVIQREISTDQASRDEGVTLVVSDHLGQTPQVTIQIGSDSVAIVLQKLAECYRALGHDEEELKAITGTND